MNAGTFNTIPGRNFTKLGSSKRTHTSLAFPGRKNLCHVELPESPQSLHFG